jgi:hypothetical protein
LEEEAADEGTTLNGLVSTVMTRHVEWASLAYRLGMVTISGNMIAAALEAADEAKLDEVARKRLPGTWKDMAIFRFHDSSLETLIRLFSLNSRYSHGGEFDTKKEGNNYTLVLSHKFGRKFSLMFASGLDELLRTTYHIQPVMEFDDALIRFRFSVE